MTLPVKVPDFRDKSSVIEEFAKMTGPVPCDGCKLCCQGHHLVVLFPEHGDDITQYETEVIGTKDGEDIHRLKFKENGDCHYLGPDGCTIHDRAPSVCRYFDCRVVFLETDRETRRRMTKSGHESRDVYRAGRERVPSLNPEAREKIATSLRGQVGNSILGIAAKYQGKR